MFRRERTVSDEMHVYGMKVSNIFDHCADGTLLVNRDYQRKLVWSLDEKQFFIDSLLRSYPVPLFILVSYKRTDERGVKGNQRYLEILDGLQRIDAIHSFIRNEFPVNFDGSYKYFDLDGALIPEVVRKELGIIQKEPKLDLELCKNFCNYELPVSMIESADDVVEDIFERINSTGKKLEKQELRHAGTSSKFASLVRRTAEELRGDSTILDVIPITEMPSISFSKKGLRYGVSIYDSFWIKHDILTPDNLRKSIDEEVIARIYSYALLDKSVHVSSSTLDQMYDSSSKLYRQLEEKLDEFGSDRFQINFMNTYEELNSIFDSVDETFSKLMFGKNDVRGKWKIYSALFMAMYDLLDQNYEITASYEEMANNLRFTGDNGIFDQVTKNNIWNKSVRDKGVNFFTNKLKIGMEKIDKKADNIIFSNNNTVREIISAIKKWGTESQMYDFKIGMYDLYSGDRNNSVISKIVKTLTAMANTHPGKEGYVIIGMADKREDAEKFKKHYSTKYEVYDKCYLTGINSEVERYFKDYEDYKRVICDLIKKEPVSSYVKDYILSNITFEIISNKIFLVLSLMSADQPLVYGDKFYSRKDSNNEEIKATDGGIHNLFARFAKC